jgi:hypothetical protein
MSVSLSVSVLISLLLFIHKRHSLLQTYQRKGGSSLNIPLPYTPGHDAAGVVAGVGEVGSLVRS